MCPALRTFAAVAAVAIALAAQDTPIELSAAMERYAGATTALQRALAARDRTAMAEPLATLLATTRALAAGTPPVRDRAAATAALDRIAGALADLQRPVGDGSESDAYDFARLRAACTGCHLQNRDRNDERGLFPNLGNVATGTVLLEERDGSRRADASGVVVFVEGVGKKAPPLPRPPAISQKERRFDPPLLVVSPGTRVVFPNDDVVFHNVFSLSRGNVFDLGTYGAGVAKERAFAAPGLVRVHCNIHPDMAANVLVLDTAWHAITAPSGFWVIPDLPDGEFTLRVWQPLADEQRHRLVVADGKATVVPLLVREVRPRLSHTNKHGRAYPEKY